MNHETHAKGSKSSGKLRLLQTTDLHMQLLAYNYAAGEPDDRLGLVGLADRIAALRAGSDATTLFFDTGDLIQGNPLADEVAANLTEDQTHPMVAALNLLGCDAMTVGNHDFDYGLQTLRAILSKASFKVVTSNVKTSDGAAIGADYVLLDRAIRCSDGAERKIRVGVTGFCPPQTAQLSGDAETDLLDTTDIVTAAKAVVPQMRAAGADIVVALCHSGIGPSVHTDRMENAAIPLAALDGIDAILAGHTHDTFPDPTGQHSEYVDPLAGTLHGKPTLMARSCGKALGVMELDLTWQAGRWDLSTSRVRLIPAKGPKGVLSPLRQKLGQLAAPLHAKTIATINAPIAQTSIPIKSYFATIAPELSQQVLARAGQDWAQNLIQRGTLPDLPLLAAKSSFRFGGRNGLEHYIDIPAGPITLRDASSIFPFVDKLYAVRRTGAEIKLWLERAASHYNHMQAGTSDQWLLNPQSAGYNCDALYGLTYQIDLREPARFDPHGFELDPTAARIKTVRYAGRPVHDADVFIVVTNSFRARGGGGFPAIPSTDILHRSSRPLRDILIAYLKEVGCITKPVSPTWAFAPIDKTAAYFASAPAARHSMNANIRHLGAGKDGFDTYQIHF